MKKLALSLIALGIALILAGVLVPVIAPSSTSTPLTTTWPLEITDDHGRTVNIAETPERIVSLAPSITEILFALDLGDKVVGVTDYCDYPEELVEKIETGETQRIGAPFPSFNLEIIVDLMPDIAFAIGATVPDYVDDLVGLGIPTIILQPEIIDDIFHDIELVGIIVGKQGDAAALVADLEDDIDEIVAKVANAPVQSVFYGVDVSDPAMLWTVGNGTFIDDLITLAGGDNIAGNLEGWPTYNLEDLVNSNPDVIVLGGANWGVSAEEVASRPIWQDLDAVKNGNIYAIDDTTLVRPGPRIANGLELLAGLIHPEFFGY
ncbi:MAG: ABC transporter substrate-binding protein [Dehalococcoidia bacterium]|nr:MAG: ABC transporter substrate-binding protein [Dehalococcoidia bacterium]